MVIPGCESEVLLGRWDSRMTERGGEQKKVGQAALPAGRRLRRLAWTPDHLGGGAVDHGAGVPSTVTGSINSTRVPSGSKRLSCRLRLIPVLISIGLV